MFIFGKELICCPWENGNIIF